MIEESYSDCTVKAKRDWTCTTGLRVGREERLHECHEVEALFSQKCITVDIIKYSTVLICRHTVPVSRYVSIALPIQD